jgi:hypothetical protein
MVTKKTEKNEKKTLRRPQKKAPKTRRQPSEGKLVPELSESDLHRVTGGVLRDQIRPRS